MAFNPYIPNPEFDEELVADEEIRSELAVHAEPAADLAKGFAPTRDEAYVGKQASQSYRYPGAYRDSIQIVENSDGVFLTATDWKAHWIEFGSVNNPVSAPLRRGAEGTGLRIADEEL